MPAAAASDTTDDAARVQIALLRRAGPARRAALARSLSRTVIDLSRSALREREPDATEREVQLRWVALEYGDELARRIAGYLAARGR